MSDGFEARVVRLEERITHIASALDDIKEGVDGFSKLAQQIGIALAHADEHVRTVNAQWKRIDDTHERVADLDKFRSSVRGAMWALGIVMTTIGGTTTAAVLWLFVSVSSSEALNGVQEHRIKEVERRLDHLSVRPLP